MTLPPIRAVALIAWRQARRSPWRSALVTAMVALPIAALACTVVALKTVRPTAQQLSTEAMGSADIMITGFTGNLVPSALVNELPAGTQVVTGTALYTQNIVRGSVVYLPVDEFSARVDQAPLRGIFAMVDGRAPAAPGEVAVDPHTLAAFGARIGDRITLEDAGLTLRVTGTLLVPAHFGDSIAVLAPGTIAYKRTDFSGFWVDLPPGSAVDKVTGVLANDPHDLILQTRDDIAHADASANAVANAGAFAGAAVALFATGLIAAAAFVVGARRQLRLLGLIGAQGGEPRHIRATVLFGGVVLGLAGSIVGVALGIAAAFALHPHLARIAGRLVRPVQLPPLPLVGAVVMGTLAATLAAYGPARSAARLSTLDALAARTPPPRRPGRLTAGGLVGVAAGAGLTAWGTIGHAGAVLAAGLVLMVGGFLLAVPLLVTSIGRLARYLPTVARLAARDLARNGRRTGAAMAAATIALALPIALSTQWLSDEATQAQTPYMASDQLSVSVAPAGPGSLVEEHRAQVLGAQLHAAFPRDLIVVLKPATPVGHPGSLIYASGAQTILHGVSFTPGGLLWIGGPDLLRAFHAEDGIAGLEAGKVVAIGPGGIDHGQVHLEHNEGLPSLDLPAVEAGATRYGSLTNSGEYNYVISPAAAALVGLVPNQPSDQSVQFVLRSPSSLSKADIDRAKAIAAEQPGASALSLGDLASDTTFARTALTLGGAAVALAILAVVLALLGAESRRDRAILVAVGAEPRTRRRLAGVNAILVAGLAGILAVPTGFAPMAVQEISRRVGEVVVVPWATIAFVLLGVPVIAGALAALGSRQPQAARLLRPLA
jgi:putative ABC transport system permease protein